ncbi:MAG: hypothetical protein ACXWMO_08350 [Syntrophales bacterium]
MRENDAHVNADQKTVNELEALKSSIAKYFNGKSESAPLKKGETLILSAMDRYFNCGRKY